MKVKFGIKASAMLSSLALATAFVAGCTEETPPDTKPASTSSRRRLHRRSGGDMAPAVPPVTAAKGGRKEVINFDGRERNARPDEFNSELAMAASST